MYKINKARHSAYLLYVHIVFVTNEAGPQHHGTDFCVDALEEALKRHGAPEIFNTDQGVQFTSEAFISVLKDHGIRISMDGKGSPT